MRRIHGEEVFGIDVDEQTRCFHYHSDIDVIAIKFKCCGRWYPCFECHSESEHRPQTWPLDEQGEKAILCGNCGYQLTMIEYFGCNSTCPRCEHPFNPGCANHYHLYFEQVEK